MNKRLSRDEREMPKTGGLRHAEATSRQLTDATRIQVMYPPPPPTRILQWKHPYISVPNYPEAITIVENLGSENSIWLVSCSLVCSSLAIIGFLLCTQCSVSTTYGSSHSAWKIVCACRWWPVLAGVIRTKCDNSYMLRHRAAVCRRFR